MESALRCHIQKGVQSSIDHGQNLFMAELRRITVLFVNLKGLNLGSKKGNLLKLCSGSQESPHLRVQQALNCMQTILFQMGGMVRQFLVGICGTQKKI